MRKYPKPETMGPLQLSFEDLYGSYKKMIYGSGLELVSIPEDAEEIMVNRFLKVQHEHMTVRSQPSTSISLIKMVIQTTYERLHPGARSSIY